MNQYQFKTTNIKGKQYVEVNERVKAFRQLPEFKGFGISTELLHLDSDSCVVRATITDASGVVTAQGMAQEDKASSMINKTSYVENCETSAVGRALGFLGIGIETSIATADEVNMAVNKQQYATPAPESDVFGQAVSYVKNQPDKESRQRAYEAVIKKYGSDWTQKQKDAILKFVK